MLYLTVCQQDEFWRFENESSLIVVPHQVQFFCDTISAIISQNRGGWNMTKRIVIALVLGLLIGAGGGSWAAINQPHMIAALEALKTAKMELEVTEHNKGGHRVKALELVHKAIEQTKKGIEAGEKGK
jgi:hypothetical protein